MPVGAKGIEMRDWLPKPVAATLIVAASDSLHPERADYLCDGVNDEVEINAAITALGTQGGEIVCLDGNYNIANDIVIAHQTIGRVLLSAYGAVFNHTGAGYCLKVLTNIAPGNFYYRVSYLHGLHIVGSAGGAGGIQINSGVFHTIEDFVIEGYSAGKGIDVWGESQQCEKTRIYNGNILNCLYGLHTRVDSHDESSYKDIHIQSNVANAILFDIEGGGFSILLDNLAAHCYADNQIAYNLAFGGGYGNILNSLKAERHAGAGQTAVRLVSTGGAIIIINYACVGAFATDIDNAANLPYTLISDRRIEIHGDTPTVNLIALAGIVHYLLSDPTGTMAWDIQALDLGATKPFAINNLDGNFALILRQDASIADGNTALEIRRRIGGAYTLQVVSMGIVDSGGAGFKLLRVPN